jgi:hypothetical protein
MIYYRVPAGVLTNMPGRGGALRQSDLFTVVSVHGGSVAFMVHEDFWEPNMECVRERVLWVFPTTGGNKSKFSVLTHEANLLEWLAGWTSKSEA